MRLPFDPSAPPGHDDAKQSVLVRALALGRELPEEPQRFSELRAEYCCMPLQQWAEGRNATRVGFAVEQLPIGALTPPLELGDTYALAQRVEPEPETRTASFTFELPPPEKPDIYYLASHTHRPQLLEHLREVASMVMVSWFASHGRA